jgi:hypothetical protein
MSSYTSGRGRVTSRRIMTDLIVRASEAVRDRDAVGWIGSADLDALAQRVPATDTLAGVRDRLADVEARPLAGALVELVQPGLLSRVQALVDGDRPGQAGGDTTEAEALLRDGLRATADRLRVDERRVGVSATLGALARLGYVVDHHEGSRSSGVYATRSDVAVLVLVHDGGAFEIDWAGYRGDACLAPMDELIAAMGDEGVALDVAAQARHGDDRGGQLIARASLAAVDGRRAVGAVRQLEQGVPGTWGSEPLPAQHTGPRQGIGGAR